MAQMRTSFLSTWTADSRSLACQVLRPCVLSQPGPLRMPMPRDAGAGVQNCSLSLFDNVLGNSVTALSTSVIMPFVLNTL